MELVPRKAGGTFVEPLCRRTLSKMARNRTVRQSVRQRPATKWAEQMVLGRVLDRRNETDRPHKMPGKLAKTGMGRLRRSRRTATGTHLFCRKMPPPLV